MVKQMKKSEQTRERIIQGAIRALVKTGVLGSTTRAIATEAGVELATLHYHFDSKSALLLAVWESLANDMNERFRTGLEGEAPDMDAVIDRWLRRIGDCIAAAKDLQVLQYELTLYALRENAEWLAEQQYDAYLRMYREALGNVPKDARTLSDADLAALARFVFAGVDGLLLQALAKPNDRHFKAGLIALAETSKAYARRMSEARSKSQKRVLA